jgi:hypothetical protein
MAYLRTLGNLLFLLTAATTAAATNSQYVFQYTDFTSTAGLNVVGSASQLGQTIRLTPASPDQRGTIWFATPQAPPAVFHTSFQFQITSPGGILDQNNMTGGDVIAFNYSDNDIATAVGFTSGDFTVMFDTFDNGDFDVSSNNVQVAFLGSTLGMQDLGAHGIDLSDGAVHTADIHYRSGSVLVSVDAMNVLAVNDVDLAMVGQPAHVSLGAFSGAAFQNHDVLNWSFRIPEPPAAIMLVSVLFFGWARRAR